MRPNSQLARQAARLALVGGSFQLLYGVLAIFYSYGGENSRGWSEALWIVACLGMAGAAAGMLLLPDVGKPRWLARLGGGATLVGVGMRIAAAVVLLLGSPFEPLPLILLSILLMLVGMLLLGIATVRGETIDGWRAWSPILVSIFGFMVAAIYDVSLYAHFILLGLWGATWMLVGNVVLAKASPPPTAGQG